MARCSGRSALDTSPRRSAATAPIRHRPRCSGRSGSNPCLDRHATLPAILPAASSAATTDTRTRRLALLRQEDVGLEHCFPDRFPVATSCCSVVTRYGHGSGYRSLSLLAPDTQCAGPVTPIHHSFQRGYSSWTYHV